MEFMAWYCERPRNQIGCSLPFLYFLKETSLETQNIMESGQLEHLLEMLACSEEEPFLCSEFELLDDTGNEKGAMKSRS